jgi:hypothetical protein
MEEAEPDVHADMSFRAARPAERHSLDSIEMQE